MFLGISRFLFIYLGTPRDLGKVINWDGTELKIKSLPVTIYTLV